MRLAASRTNTNVQNIWVCTFVLLHFYAFLPLRDGVCELILPQCDAPKELSTCPYRHLVPKPIFHIRFSGFHYFFTNSSFVSVVCPDGLT